MELVTGRATVEDLDAFVADLQAVGREHGATVQAFDARYVVDRTHLERALELADRAIDRDEAIAEDRAMEVLCYAAGTRQIERALEIGLDPGETPAVVLVDGGDEAAAADAVAAHIDTAGDPLGAYDRALVREFFDVGDAELAATDAGLPALVRERVALLVVEK
jgi:KEOPS complex subunit Cgi121